MLDGLYTHTRAEIEAILLTVQKMGGLLVHTVPCSLQPVQRVRLQRRHDGSQGREVFAYTTLLLRTSHIELVRCFVGCVFMLVFEVLPT